MTPRPRTAKDLVSRVLAHPSGGLQTLIGLAQGAEVEWLELKAACHPKGGVFADGENEADYRWHVAKAVVALANSVGGVVLLGVDDDGEPVGLDASDPDGLVKRNDLDAFKRNLFQKVLVPEAGWKTGRQGTIKLVTRARFERLISLRDVRCGEHLVLAILVDATPPEFGPVVVTRTKSGKTTEHFYARKRGEIGEVVDLPLGDCAVLQAHDEARTGFEQELGLVWDRFLARRLPTRTMEEISTAIGRYLENLVHEFSPEEKRFIPLGAVARSPVPVAAKPAGKHRGLAVSDQDWLPARTPAGGVTEASGVKLVSAAKAPRYGSAVEMLDECRRGAVLLGNAGMGKSTCFHHLALKEARAWTPGANWPLLVRLADCDDSLARLLERRSGIEWQDLAPLIASGSVTVFLDGLNECPDTTYDNCRSEIFTLLKEFPDARLFISDRQSSDADYFGLPIIDIQVMDHAQQHRLLQAYLGDEERVLRTLSQLRGQRGGESIAGNPLLMRIIAAITVDGGDVPPGRAALYRLFLESWHKRELLKPLRSRDAFPWNFDEVVRALSELAYGMRRRGMVRCPKALTTQILTPIIGNVSESFIEALADGLVLNRADTSGRVGFAHETFQEYLCAEYLAARHHDLKSDAVSSNGNSRIGTWAMPLAFAFELIADPSDAFLNAAWETEPLIAAAAVRGSDRIANLPAIGDHWTSGVVRALLGQDISADAKAISIIARLPPKYPISQYLLATLRSAGFWYAAESHETGRSRLERLRRLLCGGHFPWVELLPHAVQGRPSWSDDVGPAQRLIAGASQSVRLDDVLATATVAELCWLRRQKLIESETFHSAWPNAIAAISRPQLEIELIDLLRTDSDTANRLLPDYRGELREIACHWNLSLRVLSILVRSRVISSREIREEPGRLDDIVARTSLVNACRLAKQRVLIGPDLDDTARNRLLYAADPAQWKKNVKAALEVGLLRLEDLPSQFPVEEVQSPASAQSLPSRRGRQYPYKVADLEKPDTRTRIDAALKDKRWKVTVKRVSPQSGFGFAVHGDFDRDIFFSFSMIRDPGNHDITSGQTLEVVLTSRFDRKKQMWGFSVLSGRIDRD